MVRTAREQFCCFEELTENSSPVGIFCIDTRTNISLQASWVIAQSAFWSWSRALKTDGSKIDGVVLEWTGLDAASSKSGIKIDGEISESFEGWVKSYSFVAWNELSVAGHGVGISVEDWRVLWSTGVLWPIPRQRSVPFLSIRIGKLTSMGWFP